MNKWKEDKQLIKDLQTISIAYCSHCLNELLKYQKEKPSRYYLGYQKATPSHLIDWVGDFLVVFLSEIH